jgi:hypothetical protein
MAQNPHGMCVLEFRFLLMPLHPTGLRGDEYNHAKHNPVPSEGHKGVARDILDQPLDAQPCRDKREEKPDGEHRYVGS